MWCAFVEYRFTKQLVELERVSEGPRSRVVPGADKVVTPLKWHEWEMELRGHPDKEWVEFLIRGIREGFRLGHDQSSVVLRQRKGAMYEASQHREVISNYLEAEERANRVWRVSKSSKEDIQCSPFGVIPKKGKPGKWRLIVNLSSPDGGSVNDGIARELASVAYTSVDDVVERVLALGEGAEIAKADVKTAYRNVPVHPRDRWLLGMEWEGETLIDGALPFGLRSAPLIFTALGDAIQWIATEKGATWLRHYVDDFVAVGKKDTGECAKAMKVFKETCQQLGVPLDESKEEGPSEVITFLGIEIDTAKMEVRLPQNKLDELRSILKKWKGMKSCRRRDLESIVGSLNHACKAVRAGRAFKRRLQNLMTSVDRDDRRVRLNVEARADLDWWYQFGINWNGTSLMKSIAAREVPQEVMLSDASGTWGCGATWNEKWFQLRWSELETVREWNIMPKEMLPIVVAAVVWGRYWKDRTVKARCDNMAVVATIRSGSCKEKRAMHLMRCLAFVEATVPVNVVAEHIRGVDNVVADALSRDNLQLARSTMQVSAAETEKVPHGLMELLTETTLSWSEQEWTRLRGFCLTKD